MKRVSRFLMILLVIILVILGLNTSYKATNSMTMESEKPFIGFTIEKENINIIALGEEYSYSREELSKESNSVLDTIQAMFQAVVDYLKKIWTIFRVIFLT